MKTNNKSGFTLLEIIIVIIIVGVLASLALPRFFSTVEFSKSTEALSSLSSIRQSMERCYLGAGGTYASCNINTLDLENPGLVPGARFSYAIVGVPTAISYVLTATRVSVDGGTAGDTITLTQTGTVNGTTRSGTTKFIGIK